MKYQENYQIQYADCDETGHVKLQALIDIFMHVSNRQLENSQAGSKEMAMKNQGWVVTQYHMDFKRLPVVAEQVKIITKPVGYNRFFEYRDFSLLVYDKEIIKVQSQWVILDLEKRRIVPADSEVMARFGSPLLKKNPKMRRLRKQDNYEQTRQYRVRYDDLDLNHHMTNSHYFSWMEDMLERAFLNAYEPKSVDIKFDKEVLYGQKVTSSLLINEQTSYHLISQGDQVATIAEITWKKRNDE